MLSGFFEDCQPCYILHEYTAGDIRAARQEHSKLQNRQLEESTFKKHLARINTLVSDLKDVLSDREKQSAKETHGMMGMQDFIDAPSRNQHGSRPSGGFDPLSDHALLDDPLFDDAHFEDALSTQGESREPMPTETLPQPMHNRLASGSEHPPKNGENQSEGQSYQVYERDFVGKPSSDSPISITSRKLNAFHHGAMAPLFESREWMSADTQRQPMHDRPREHRIIQEASRNPFVNRGPAIDDTKSRNRSVGSIFPYREPTKSPQDFERPASISLVKKIAAKRSDPRTPASAVVGAKDKWENIRITKHDPRQNRDGWDVVEAGVNGLRIVTPKELPAKHGEVEDESAEWDLCE